MALIYGAHLRRSLIYGASLTHLSNLSWLLVASQSTRRQFRHCCTVARAAVRRRPFSVVAPSSELVYPVPHHRRRWRLRRPPHMDGDHIAGRSAHRPRVAGVQRQVGGRTRTVAGARDRSAAVRRGAAPRVRCCGVRPAAQHRRLAAVRQAHDEDRRRRVLLLVVAMEQQVRLGPRSISEKNLG